MSRLVTVASFATGLEARMALGYLESCGVPAFLADENTTRIANHLTPLTGGMGLQVADSDSERARTLLAEKNL